MVGAGLGCTAVGAFDSCIGSRRGRQGCRIIGRAANTAQVLLVAGASFCKVGSEPLYPLGDVVELSVRTVPGDVTNVVADKADDVV